MRKVLSIAVLLAATALHATTARAAGEADPTDKDSLEKRLDRDYATLLKADAHPSPIREAERLLISTNQNSRWTDFSKAVTLLRQHRSKAAIPLLMQHMVEHAALTTSRITIPADADTISILAGEKINIEPPQGPDRQQVMVDAVVALYTDWWKAKKDKLVVDLGEMTDEQIKFVVSELLRHSQDELFQSKGSGRNKITTQQRYEALTTSLEGKAGRQTWWDEELHPRMAPLLLADAGYEKNPAGAVTDGSGTVDFAAVPLLSALNLQSRGLALDKIAKDPWQNNAVRLTCMLALRGAGNSANSDALLAIYATDPRQECRVLSLLMLARSDNKKVTQTLVKALDDDNLEISLAALETLRTLAPRAALPKLIKVLQDNQPAEMVLPGIMLLGKIGGDQASGALVAYMEKVLADGGDPYRSGLSRALIALSESTGTRWIEAGAHTPTYYQDRARAAIAAWKAAHP